MKVGLRKTWDIFCRVIDNFGDIGVCWRLAKQLKSEHQKNVRLWVDDLNAFKPLLPDLSPQQVKQYVEGIQVCHWGAPFEATEIADVVIEAFACNIPENYMTGMHLKTASGNPTLWLNLEYLTAESWVENCHRLPSPHPQYPLSKIFFFPGLTVKTGGLLREKNLFAQRDQFTSERAKRDITLLKIFMFAYETIPASDLIHALEQSSRSIEMILPPGKAREAFATHFQTEGQSEIPNNYKSLTFKAIDFVPQKEFDQQLWLADLLFVRGEDSFVRAIWSGKPFIWHIYPQEDNYHFIKLEAFLEKYTTNLSSEVSTAIKNMMLAWNKVPDSPPLDIALGDYFSHWNQIQAHAVSWCQHLSQQADLAQQLIDLSDNTV